MAKRRETAAPAIDSRAVARLRGETFLDEKTIRRWASGKKVFEANARTLERAAHKLGIIIGGQPAARP